MKKIINLGETMVLKSESLEEYNKKKAAEKAAVEYADRKKWEELNKKFGK